MKRKLLNIKSLNKKKMQEMKGGTGEAKKCVSCGTIYTGRGCPNCGGGNNGGSLDIQQDIE